MAAGKQREVKLTATPLRAARVPPPLLRAARAVPVLPPLLRAAPATAPCSVPPRCPRGLRLRALERRGGGAAEGKGGEESPVVEEGREGGEESLAIEEVRGEGEESVAVEEGRRRFGCSRVGKERRPRRRSRLPWRAGCYGKEGKRR
jgi:hypothetical protein